MRQPRARFEQGSHRLELGDGIGEVFDDVFKDLLASPGAT